MALNASPTLSEPNQLSAANGLALVSITLGAVFVWVFFENLGKGLYGRRELWKERRQGEAAHRLISRCQATLTTTSVTSSC
jgi:hypothetical protein